MDRAHRPQYQCGSELSDGDMVLPESSGHSVEYCRHAKLIFYVQAELQIHYMLNMFRAKNPAEDISADIKVGNAFRKIGSCSGSNHH